MPKEMPLAFPFFKIHQFIKGPFHKVCMCVCVAQMATDKIRTAEETTPFSLLHCSETVNHN